MTVPPPASGRTAAPGARARRRVRTGEPVAYDFRKPIQLSREHARILHVGFDGFARQGQTVLTSGLRTPCQMTLASIVQRSYAEYVDSLDETTCMTIFTAEPIHGAGVLELPLPIAMTCIDHMLGGPGGPQQPNRPLSEIEVSVIRGLVERLLAEMRYSLAAVVAVDPSITGVEHSPRFAQVAGAADVMVVATFELRVGEGVHPMTLCLPFSGLLPHLAAAVARAAVSDREQAQRTLSAEQLHAQLQHVPMVVSVRFRPTTLTPAELGELRVGEVVRLSHPAAAPLDVTVDGTTFAHATAGSRGRRLAAQVVALPEKES